MSYDETQSNALVYQIKVRGHLAEHWSQWFDGMTITHHPDGSTVLQGIVIDGTALYGLISRARDLGLTLIAVQCLNDDNSASRDLSSL